jgi:hypothetical protein
LHGFKARQLRLVNAACARHASPRPPLAFIVIACAFAHQFARDAQRRVYTNGHGGTPCLALRCANYVARVIVSASARTVHGVHMIICKPAQTFSRATFRHAVVSRAANLAPRHITA